MSKMQSDLEQSLIIVHELAQPLAVISLTADSMLRQPDRLPDDVLRSVRLISDQVIRASNITRRLREAPCREPISLNTLVQEATDLVFMTQGSKVERVIELDDRITIVKLDKFQIEQVLVNLIRNALEAMRDIGQHLIVRTKFAITHVEISVIDDGPGINEEIAGNIFQPFVSSKPSGFGIGLSISNGIVEAHNGTLTVRPVNGRGTCFVVRLPIG